MTSLSNLMNFDVPVIVDTDHTVTEAPSSLYYPTVLNEKIISGTMGEEWEFASTGYSRQDYYQGPIMHDSELLGGRLATDILNEPGVYCLVAAWYADEYTGDDTETIAEGWAVVRLIDPTDYLNMEG